MPGNDPPAHLITPLTAVATCALLLWFIALVLPAFAWPRHLESGAEVLARGAAGVLVLNFAWFANITAAIWLLAPKPSPKLALATSVLALQAFMFWGEPGIAGSGGTRIYGFGWGAVAWVCAMQLILVADSLAGRRLRPDDRGIVGLAFLVAAAGGAAWLAFDDRATANAAERVRLAPIAFKRGDVCSVEPPIAEALPGDVSSIAVVSDHYRLADPSAFLIGHVREAVSGNWSYQRASPSQSPFLIKRVRASTPKPAVELYVLSAPSRFQIELRGPAGKQAAVWNRLEREGEWCPAADTNLSSTHDPMRFLAKLLGLSAAEASLMTFGGSRYQLPPSQPVAVTVEARRQRRVDLRHEPPPNLNPKLYEVPGCGNSVAIRDSAADPPNRRWVQLGEAQFDAQGFRLLRCEGNLLFGLATVSLEGRGPDRVTHGELFVWDVKAETTVWRTSVAIPQEFVAHQTKWTSAAQLGRSVRATLVRSVGDATYEEVDVRIDRPDL